VRGGQEGEYRNLVEAFTDCTKNNCLLLNTTKTKELVSGDLKHHASQSTLRKRS